MQMNMKCASPSRVNVRVVPFVQHRNVRVLVWSMCEWSGFYNTGMCECLFDQCASGPVFTSPKCASASLVNVRVVKFFGFAISKCASGLIFTTPECASATLANVRVVWFSQHRNVRVLVWSMCEWS